MFKRLWYRFMIWGTCNRIAETGNLAERWMLYQRLASYQQKLNNKRQHETVYLHREREREDQHETPE